MGSEMCIRDRTMTDIVLEDIPLVNLPDVARRASPQETTWNNGVLDLQQDGSRLVFRRALLGLRPNDVNRRHFGGTEIPDEPVGVHRVVMAKPVVRHGANNWLRSNVLERVPPSSARVAK